MKKFLVLLLCFTAFLGSCGRNAADFLAYQDKKFRAEIRASGDRSFGGVFTKDGDGVSFTFSSPDGMSGIIARREGEKATVTLDGVTVADKNVCDAFLSFEKIFALDGDILSVERATDAARGRVIVVRLLCGGKNYTVSLAAGRPFRITFDGTTVDIVWLEFI